MKWVLKEIAVGDMVRVPMGDMFHYGVCVGEDEIIQFGEPILGNPVPKEDIRIMTTDVASFLSGQFAEVAELDRKEMKKRRSVAETVSYAVGRLGEGGYDILYNNCEHFANECVFGRHISSQVDSVREEIEAKMPPIFVFVAEVGGLEREEKLPSFLKKELKRISKPSVAEEKLCAYSLLKQGAEKALGLDIDLRKCRKTKNGKPFHKDICFSISHSHGLCAVALSKKEVGVDIELEIPSLRAERMEGKIRHPNEDPEADLTLLWTRKEAIFKHQGEKTFIPHTVDTTLFKCKSARVESEGRSFCLSVAADNVMNVRFLKDFLKSGEIPDDSLR